MYVLVVVACYYCLTDADHRMVVCGVFISLSRTASRGDDAILAMNIWYDIPRISLSRRYRVMDS